MSIKKFGLTLSLFATFGLMACGDDSSSGSSFDENTEIKCDSDSTETSYKIVAKGGDFYTSEEGSYEGPSLKTIIISTLPDEAIEEMCSNEDIEAGDMMKISCDGNKMTQEMTVALANEDFAKIAFESSRIEAFKRCSDMNGKTVKEIQKFLDDEDEDNDDEEGGVACDEQCQQELDNLNQDINEGFEENLEEMID